MSAPMLHAEVLPPAPDRRPFWGKCVGCGHCWPIAYLPMPMADFARVAKGATCPSCAGADITIAKQDGGVLLEPDGAVAP